MNETRAAITAHTGVTFERLVKYHIDKWKEEVSDGEFVIDYDVDVQTFKARNVIGEEEYQNIHAGAKHAASRVIEHVKDVYLSKITDVHHVGLGGPEEVKRLTGRISNADLVMFIDPLLQDTKLFDALGASCKYSIQGKSSPIKIFSPSIQQLLSSIEEAAGGALALKADMASIAEEGLLAMQAVVRQHDAYLAKTFETPYKCRDGWANYKDRVLSQAAISWLRDFGSEYDRSIYDDISAANRNMNRTMALCFYNNMLAIFTKNNQEKAENVLRVITNTRLDKVHLPTFTLLTERKHNHTTAIGDVFVAINHYLKDNTVIEIGHKPGSAGVQIGPGRLAFDTRATVTRNPLAFSANYYLRHTSFMKAA